jgi:tetratricopeptide (TPR) repeat protein
MYSDPAVRESEIKNMSQVYTELKTGVLPELRRARFIANVEYQNYTADELKDLVDRNIDVLDEEALLRVASLVDDDKKVDIYKKAIDKYGSDRAQYNLGVAYLNLGKDDLAEQAFNKVKAADADLQNAKGIIALHKGDLAAASRAFAAAGDANGKANQGIVDILSGNYDKAAAELADAPGCCNNTVLAYILTKQYDKAAAAVHCNDPRVHYLKAIIAARQGKAAEAKEALEKAYANDALKARAAKDVEFAGLNL